MIDFAKRLRDTLFLEEEKIMGINPKLRRDIAENYDLLFEEDGMDKFKKAIGPRRFQNLKVAIIESEHNRPLKVGDIVYEKDKKYRVTLEEIESE